MHLRARNLAQPTTPARLTCIAYTGSDQHAAVSSGLDHTNPTTGGIPARIFTSGIISSRGMKAHQEKGRRPKAARVAEKRGRLLFCMPHAGVRTLGTCNRLHVEARVPPGYPAVVLLQGAKGPAFRDLWGPGVACVPVAHTVRARCRPNGTHSSRSLPCTYPSNDPEHTAHSTQRTQEEEEALTALFLARMGAR